MRRSCSQASLCAPFKEASCTLTATFAECWSASGSGCGCEAVFCKLKVPRFCYCVRHLDCWSERLPGLWPHGQFSRPGDCYTSPIVSSRCALSPPLFILLFPLTISFEKMMFKVFVASATTLSMALSVSAQIANCARNYTVQPGDVSDAISAANHVSTYVTTPFSPAFRRCSKRITSLEQIPARSC